MKEVLNVKLATFDLDGTIVGPDNKISERTVRAIRALKDQGVIVAVATGRPWFGAKKFANEIGANGPCMTYSGALILDPKTQDIVLKRVVDHKLVSLILEKCKKHEIYCEVYTRDDYYISQKTKFTEVQASLMGLEAKVADLNELSQQVDVIKIGFISPISQVPIIREEFFNLSGLSTMLGETPVYPDLVFTSITDDSASRDRAFEFYCDHLNLTPQNIMAFGDAHSDLTFIKRAGVGVAVASAPEEVKKAANYVIPSVNDDGVAMFLEALVSGDEEEAVIEG